MGCRLRRPKPSDVSAGAPERYIIGRVGGRGGSCAGLPTPAETPPAGWFPRCWAVAILAAYANSFDIPFVFDDWHTIEQNPAIRSLSNLPRFFYDPNSTTVLRENKDLRPLLVASLALNHRISGLVPWSYHAVNLLLHWIATLLVYRIVRDHLWLDADGAPVALAAALIVAVHPLNTESVDYVSARSALLTTVFYLAAFDAAARDRRAVAMLLAACAMLTKSIAVTLPLAVLLHRVVAPSYRRRPVPWGFIGCLALVAAAGILYRWWLLPPWVVAAARQPGVTSWTYFVTEWSALVYYLRLFVWPNALVVDRVDYPYASVARRRAGVGQPAGARRARGDRVALRAAAARLRLRRALVPGDARTRVELLPARRARERAPALPGDARARDARRALALAGRRVRLRGGWSPRRRGSSPSS